jgi:hypothetical protein
VRPKPSRIGMSRPGKKSPLPFDQPVMTEDLTNVIGSRAEDDHHKHPRAAGPIAVGQVSLARRHRAWHGVDS